MLRYVVALVFTYLVGLTAAAFDIEHVYHKRGTLCCDIKGDFPEGPFGGSGGNAFSDEQQMALNGDITAIEVYNAARINSIRVKYGDTWGNRHGRTTGTRNLIELKPREKITKVSGNKFN